MKKNDNYMLIDFFCHRHNFISFNFCLDSTVKSAVTTEIVLPRNSNFILLALRQSENVELLPNKGSENNILCLHFSLYIVYLRGS